MSPHASALKRYAHFFSILPNQKAPYNALGAIVKTLLAEIGAEINESSL